MKVVEKKLKALAVKTIADCTITKKTAYFGAEADSDVLLPSGDEKYYSFWVRDAAMMAESGLVSDEDLKRYVEIIATCGQNGGETLYLANGLQVPPYAVADHVNYDGKPVFYPGTYDSGNDQGDGTYGTYPPFCDNYYFILMACSYVNQSGDRDILNQSYSGMTLLERLEKAFLGYNIDSATQLCVSDSAAHTVDWGFVDQVKKSGKLLMASLLRYNAALALSELLSEPQYTAIAAKIKDQILATFYDDTTGWFYSATGLCHQHDVWATAFAVFSGITENEKTLSALARAYENKTAVVDGYVRHVLTDEDFSNKTAWESTITPYQTYQNGAYWATPTGWYAYALYLHSGKLTILEDFLRHTEAYASQGAPFEWINADTTDFSGLNYGTSGVLPYIGIMKILQKTI